MRSEPLTPVRLRCRLRSSRPVVDVHRVGDRPRHGDDAGFAIHYNAVQHQPAQQVRAGCVCHMLQGFMSGFGVRASGLGRVGVRAGVKGLLGSGTPLLGTGQGLAYRYGASVRTVFGGDQVSALPSASHGLVEYVGHLC